MLASAPTFLCFLLNMIIKKRADNIRPYDFLMGAQKGESLFGERRHYGMRAGWILLEIRHKQYGVHVDEVGAAICRPKVIET